MNINKPCLRQAIHLFGLTAAMHEPHALNRYPHIGEDASRCHPGTAPGSPIKSTMLSRHQLAVRVCQARPQGHGRYAATKLILHDSWADLSARGSLSCS